MTIWLGLRQRHFNMSGSQMFDGYPTQNPPRLLRPQIARPLRCSLGHARLQGWPRHAGTKPWPCGSIRPTITASGTTRPKSRSCRTPLAQAGSLPLPRWPLDRHSLRLPGYGCRFSLRRAARRHRQADATGTASNSAPRAHTRRTGGNRYRDGVVQAPS